MPKKPQCFESSAICSRVQELIQLMDQESALGKQLADITESIKRKEDSLFSAIVDIDPLVDRLYVNGYLLDVDWDEGHICISATATIHPEVLPFEDPGEDIDDVPPWALEERGIYAPS